MYDHMNKTHPDRQTVKTQSARIIATADSETGSALKCLHWLSVAGAATADAYKAVEQRILSDTDAQGAYHLAMLAQTTPDLPIDAKALIELAVQHGDNRLRLALLQQLPMPPVALIHSLIVTSNDAAAIEQMRAYLSDNPDGLGGSGPLHQQSQHIIPLTNTIPQK